MNYPTGVSEDGNDMIMPLTLTLSRQGRGNRVTPQQALEYRRMVAGLSCPLTLTLSRQGRGNRVAITLSGGARGGGVVITLSCGARGGGVVITLSCGGEWCHTQLAAGNHPD